MNQGWQRCQPLPSVMRGGLRFQILSMSQTTPTQGRANQSTETAPVMVKPIQLGHPQKDISHISDRSHPLIHPNPINQAAIPRGITTAISTVVRILQVLFQTFSLFFPCAKDGNGKGSRQSVRGCPGLPQANGRSILRADARKSTQPLALTDLATAF